MTPEVTLASETEGLRWLAFRASEGGITPDHQVLLQRTAAAGRLAPFCVWPCPKGIAPDGNVIIPRVEIRRVDGRPILGAPHRANPPNERNPIRGSHT